MYLMNKIYLIPVGAVNSIFSELERSMEKSILRFMCYFSTLM